MAQATKGSRKYLQKYVNNKVNNLNNAILSSCHALADQCIGPIEWVSPLAQNNYREFRDGAYLKALGLEEQRNKLSEFWPKGGPSWDALAKVNTHKGPVAILVEAKSHIRETPGRDKCKAKKPENISKITRGLDKARKIYGVKKETLSWRDNHYQVANRLAHLYFMNIELKVPTWLVWLFITNDPEWKDGASETRWHKYLDDIYGEIGLRVDHPLSDRTIIICLPPI